MKKTILLSLIITLGTINYVSAKAKIPLCIPCQTLQTIEELPTGAEIQKLAGQKVNLSYINDEYGFFWIPVWNANGRYVLSDISNNTFLEIDEQAARLLKEKHDFSIETAGNPLSFWKKIGGKLVFLSIILLLIWGNVSSKNKKKEPQPTNI
ncbi:hypothetical protein [Chitinophaga nivalis]|uniref:Uncharacterized protein n=1 Tax=Chitinophaga nivalis TaxID=2991709 RepID=A0ABT3IK41_9BACT|nr:hypothetical protein [Chitinophaga nivalis]MCW3465977.1 hypothetical protein [Chitinophaga nivalis]MCW3484332.1 hypothetical protein [Chitinophaga nivalis]